MNKFLYLFPLIGLVILAAFTLPPTSSTPPSISGPAPQAQATSTAQPTSTPSAPGAGRTASLREIVNDVQARLSSALNFVTAPLGLTMNVGGQVRTGADAKARLDFSEGTIVRLGENTSLTVEEISTGGNIFTRLQFELGRLWISLKGGAMDVKTPVGVATVRGSYLGLVGIPLPNGGYILIIYCYEGDCGILVSSTGQTFTMGNLSSIVIIIGPNGQLEQIQFKNITNSDLEDSCSASLDFCKAVLNALGITFHDLPGGGIMIERGRDLPPPPVYGGWVPDANPFYTAQVDREKAGAKVISPLSTGLGAISILLSGLAIAGVVNIRRNRKR